jgi:prepilin-type N-terminal cleavage/methylation domain-containing protein
MQSSRPGFALFEVVLALVVLGIAGAVALQGGLALARSVQDGRRWTDAALLGSRTLAELEAAYRLGSPACAVPPGGWRADRGIRADWSASDLGGAVEVALVLRAGVRAGTVDTLVARMACR